jgi:hypothetical protein
MDPAAKADDRRLQRNVFQSIAMKKKGMKTPSALLPPHKYDPI